MSIPAIFFSITGLAQQDMHTQSVSRTDVQTSVEGQGAVADGNEPVLDGRWPRKTDAVILHGNEQQPFTMAAAQAMDLSCSSAMAMSATRCCKT